MTYMIPLSAAALCASLAIANAAPGYRTDTLDVDHRSLDLDLHIWYPTDEATPITMIGKNAVFKGTGIRADAPMTSGAHPLVVLSHGSGGNAVNIAWIAADLADRGMIVIAPNHHGTTSRDSHPHQTIKIWERPQDLSAIIDYATATMEIDTDNIGSVGFSLGGFSSLSIAGARVIKQDFIDYCLRNTGKLDCQWYENGGVDLNDIDQAHYEQSNHDPRISAAVAIDPALSRALDDASLAAMNIPVQLINLGNTDHVPEPYNLSQIAPQFAQAEHQFIDQATHFSFMGECTAMGKVIIMAMGEDAICSEVGSRKRADIQAELKDTIGDFLHAHLIGDTQTALAD